MPWALLAAACLGMFAASCSGNSSNPATGPTTSTNPEGTNPPNLLTVTIKNLGYNASGDSYTMSSSGGTYAVAFYDSTCTAPLVGNRTPTVAPGATTDVCVKVTVPSGARVADALRAAGGTLPGTDFSALNLARKLSDGEQIYVGVPVPPAAVAAPGGGAGAAPRKVDLNTATPDQLDELPGVGEVTAKRIVDWRTEHGSFSSVDQLREVDGIGAAKLARLRDQVVVS